MILLGMTAVSLIASGVAVFIEKKKAKKKQRGHITIFYGTISLLLYI